MFHTTYSGDDQIIRKNDPDKDAENFVYDDRELLTHRQDGKMRDEGRWYSIHRDSYGRSDIEGFATSSTSGISDPLIFNTYGSDRGSIGKITIQSSKVLNTELSIVNEFEFDDCGRLEVTRSNSILYPDIGSIVDSLQLDAAGNILYHFHKIPEEELVVRMRNSYDGTGRLRHENMQVTTPEQTWTEQTLSYRDYTIKEQIMALYLGSTLQKIDYLYLPNRYLSAINNTLESSDVFKMKIGYDTNISSQATGFEARANGDIAVVEWQSRNSSGTASALKAYRYKYNYLDMLTEAQYFEGSNSSKTGTYKVNYTYEDDRGNPDNITRYGVNPSTFVKFSNPIDNLNFSYWPGTNCIQSVSDNANATEKPHGYQEGSGNYDYDPNGSTMEDPSKAADFIRNFLNLPYKIELPDSNGMVAYYYTADGTLQRQEEIRNNAVVAVRDYIGMTEYFNGSLDQIKHANGYVMLDRELDEEHLNLKGTETVDNTYESLSTVSERSIPNGRTTAYKAEEFVILTPGFEVSLGGDFLADIDEFPVQGLLYRYFVKDHLGSVRVEFEPNGFSPKVISQHHYYPFGHPMVGDWENDTRNNYRYTGQEEQYSFQLGYNRFLFRNSDPLIGGRFLSVDPLADDPKQISMSSYAAMGNNPVRFVDPDGRMAVPAQGGPGPTAVGILFEAFQNARAGLFNTQQRIAERLGFGNGQTVTRMRVNYNDDGSIPVANPVNVSSEPKKGFLAEVGDAALDLVSFSPVAELGAARGLSGPFLAARTPASIIPSIARQFDNLQCMECADAIISALKTEGLAAEVLDVVTPKSTGMQANIWSDAAGMNISENGRHRAILVDGKVYDNIHPNGISYEDWFNDLHAPGGFEVQRTNFK